MQAWGVPQNDVSPSLEYRLGNVELPADLVEERSLIGVDFVNFQPGHLAPRFRGVVAILQILRGQNEGSEKHTPATHEGVASRTIRRLLHGEVTPRYEWLDEHQIVQSDLQRRVARA